MTSTLQRRSLANVRSYYFRQLVATHNHEQHIYGGRHIEDYELEDFRTLWKSANATAREMTRRAATPWGRQ